MILRKLIPRLAVTLALVLMVSGLLPAGMAMAADDPVPQVVAEGSVTPNTANNSGTEVLHFDWDLHDWQGPADYYTFQINILGQPNNPIYILYSDGQGADNFPGIVPADLQDVSGLDGATEHVHTPGEPSSSNWTVPASFPPGSYAAWVRLYLESDPNTPAAGAFIPFTILQAEGNLEIIKVDGDQNPLSGWHFEVTGPVNMSGDTGPSGNLTFMNIPMGQYTVTETLQNGWINTDPGGSAPYDKQVNVPFDDTATVTFVNVEDIGELEIFKFNDLDGDGNYEPGNGETGLDGWHFEVTGPMNMNGDTSGGGYLTFSDIPTGNYNISETLQNGWASTTPATQNNVAVGIGGTTTVEFGNWELGSIDIFKYEDLDGNGIFDNGDTGLANWSFNVSGASGNPYTTDGTGHVMVNGLVPGNHTVTEMAPLPTGWFNTDPGGAPPYDKVVNVPTGGTADVEFGNNMQEVIVPTVGQWGMITLGGLLGLALAVTIVRRRKAAIEVAGR